MKELFRKYKNRVVRRADHSGRVAGYNDHHILLAVETSNHDFFRITERGTFITPRYRDTKFRYEYCDESTLLNLKSRKK